MRRLANNIKNSNIRAVFSLTGDNCGTLGPRFMIQDQDWNHKDLPLEQLADFLNDASGIDSGQRIIDENVEKGLFSDFSDVLSVENGRYIYTGPMYAGPSGFFSASYNESREEVEKETALLNFANSKTSREAVGDFATSESYAVLQHEVGITNGTSAKPIIGSYGAGPCIIMAIWNSNTKEAALAHIDALTSLSSVRSLFARIANDDNDSLEVHLHGGDSSSKKQAMEIVELVKSQNNAEIISANLCSLFGGSKSLALDSRTGKTFTIFSAKRLEHSSDFMIKLQMIELQFEQSPLKLSFDGRNLTPKVHEVSTAPTFFAPVSKTSGVTASETYCGLKPGFLLNNNF